MRDRLVDRVALRLCLPASAGTWGVAKFLVLRMIPLPLRWVAEWP